MSHLMVFVRYYAALDYILEYGGGINMKKDTHDYTAVQYFKEHGVQPFHFMKVLYCSQSNSLLMSLSRITFRKSIDLLLFLVQCQKIGLT